MFVPHFKQKNEKILVRILFIKLKQSITFCRGNFSVYHSVTVKSLPYFLKQGVKQCKLRDFKEISYSAKHHCLPGISCYPFSATNGSPVPGQLFLFFFAVVWIVGLFVFFFFFTENIGEVLRGDASFELPTELC